MPSWVRSPSASSSAQGSEPRPPASATATAMSASTAPAIGAWTIGSSMPKRSRMRRSGHIAVTSPRRPARGRTRCRRGRGPRSWSSRPRRPASTLSRISRPFASIGTPALTMSPQLMSMSSGIWAKSRSLVATLIVGAGFEPKAEPRPVVKTTTWAPPAIWPVADDRVVAGGVHEDEAGLGDGLGVLVDGGQRRRAALGGGAERFLEDGGQAALLVAGRGVVVHRAAVDRGVVLPPADALDQLVARPRGWRRGGAAAARRRRSPGSRRGSRCRPCRRAGRRRRRGRGWR